MDDDGREILLMLREAHIMQREQLVLLAREMDLIKWLVQIPHDRDDGPEDDGPGPAPEHPNIKNHKINPAAPEFLKEYQ